MIKPEQTQRDRELLCGLPNLTAAYLGPAIGLDVGMLEPFERKKPPTACRAPGNLRFTALLLCWSGNLLASGRGGIGRALLSVRDVAFSQDFYGLFSAAAHPDGDETRALPASVLPFNCSGPTTFS